jgi:hypothetical protein
MLLTLLAVQGLLGSGCTAILWEDDRFAHFYQPAEPPNLKLYYSNRKKDMLVAFDQAKEGDPTVRSRAYWLEQNMKRTSNQQKPHFVSPEQAKGLTSIPVFESAPEPRSEFPDGFYGVSSTNSSLFTLSSGKQTISEQKLPAYHGPPSRRVAQVLLTPFALAVDATIVGAVLAYYYGPEIANSLAGSSR